MNKNLKMLLKAVVHSDFAKSSLLKKIQKNSRNTAIWKLFFPRNWLRE